MAFDPWADEPTLPCNPAAVELLEDEQRYQTLLEDQREQSFERTIEIAIEAMDRRGIKTLAEALEYVGAEARP